MAAEPSGSAARWVREKVSVDERAAGLRADAAMLVLFEGTSRRAVAKAFAEGKIRLDDETGLILTKGEKLKRGQTLFVEELYSNENLRVIPEPEAPLRVVREMPEWILVDKPGGQACHPIDFGERGTLAGELVGRYPELAGVGDNPLIPGLVHRLDGGTEGLVLVARTQEAFLKARTAFDEGTVEKSYLALVEGRVVSAGAVSGFLVHNYQKGVMRMVRATPGHHGDRPLKAETFYRPADPSRTMSCDRVAASRSFRTERSAPNAELIRNVPSSPAFAVTLLRVTIRTGVTHQIRAQLAETGHPVVGDILYGAKPGHWPEGAHALRSIGIRFPFGQFSI